ncbi:cation diffusion facilitator family transporter [Exiguobacterium alkaliphilum]|uniref:cation diffusion facilitator family transporter n=1 Tax=Exiguobacterium alkaliphilum TaxID=1428684 RepID=UPI00403B1723
MAKENALLNDHQWLSEDVADSFDFDELEERLQSQIEEELADLEFLKDEKEKIGNVNYLGNVIKDVVWDQFMNQIAVTAGEDFIKENNGLKLDLRNDAHIQTTDNFVNGNIATHNTKIDYQKRYDNMQSNFVKDSNGNVITHKTRSGKKEATLVGGARKPFDNNRPSGSVDKRTDMDHTISAAEILRDPAANAHMTKNEQIAFANSEINLNEMDSSLNRSKSDMATTEWLDNPNANGQKPNEIFDISDEDDKKMRKKDAEAREEYEKQKKEAEKKSGEAGKQSQKEEAFRLGGKALRAVLMQLLADLVKEMIAKLVKWLKSAKKGLDTLLDSLKEAIHSFISKMKTHMVNAGKTVFSTVVTAIIGPIFGTIKKVWMLLKQGWKSLKDAVDYMRRPENKGKPIDRLLLETGKILIAGLTGAGALLVGEVIEKSLTTIPIFIVEIPLLGSLASILGIFFGAVVAGIIGAIAINLLDKLIAKKQKQEVQAATIAKGNQIIAKQHQIQIVNETLLDRDKESAQANILGRHQEAVSIMRDAYGNVMEDFVEDFSEIVNLSVINEEDVTINEEIDMASNDLDDLLTGLK